MVKIWDRSGTMKTLVMIEARNYSLQVNDDDAISMHKIVDEVNETIKSLHFISLKRDRQDCMAMSLLTLAVEAVRIGSSISRYPKKTGCYGSRTG